MSVNLSGSLRDESLLMEKWKGKVQQWNEVQEALQLAEANSKVLFHFMSILSHISLLLLLQKVHAKQQLVETLQVP